MSVQPQPELSPNAIETLRRRYLRRDQAGRVVETPADLLHRVAKSVALAERSFGADDSEVDQVSLDFYGAMARGEFLPNSPTLMNAGRAGGMLSACFVLPIDDSIEGIFDSVKHAALIQKAGGGTGFSFDRLRPTGDYIASSGGSTSGLISFWRVFSEATRAIQQGAMRRGANMGMLSVTHPDILKFVVAKASPGAFENFNISVKVSNGFMAEMAQRPDGPHVVVNPRTGGRHWLPKGLDIASYVLADLPRAETGKGPGTPVWSRRDVWNLIVHEAWSTGEPGICFIDRVNAANPTPSLGRIEATNPCGEQPLLDYEACNLGSVNLARFVRHGRLNEKALAGAVRLGVRFLDDVVEVNHYPMPQVDSLCRANRKIGLGVMGLADAMFELGVPYDSDAGLALARRIAELLANEAHDASEELARRRGTFPNFVGSLWDTPGRSMRNAAVTTVAPTGTLSILASTSGGIEPVFALAFYRHILEGTELIEVNRPFRRFAEKHGFWSDQLAARLAGGERLRDIADVPEPWRGVFVTAPEVAPKWHVRMQAAFQEFIDGAISKTINLPRQASESDVDGVFGLAFELGCKGVTVYRDGSRPDQPMGHDPAESFCPRCHRPVPANAAWCSRCPCCGATLCS